MDNLLPCPFCGGEAEAHAAYDIDTDEVDGYFVICRNKNCTAWPETAEYPTEAEAIAAWNTRAERTCFADEVTHRDCKYSVNRGWRERTCKMNRVKAFPEYEDCAFECWECSACKRTNDEQRPRFCPRCGAKVVD